jgi:hypothetical protein
VTNPEWPGQDEPSQQIAQIARDHPEAQPHTVGPAAMAGKAVQCGASLPSLIHCSAVPR